MQQKSVNPPPKAQCTDHYYCIPKTNVPIAEKRYQLSVPYAQWSGFDLYTEENPISLLSPSEHEQEADTETSGVSETTSVTALPEASHAINEPSASASSEQETTTTEVTIRYGIAQIINESPGQKEKLPVITAKFQKKYRPQKTDLKGLNNSIRHTLSLNKEFKLSESDKHFWTVDMELVPPPGKPKTKKENPEGVSNKPPQSTGKSKRSGRNKEAKKPYQKP